MNTKQGLAEITGQIVSVLDQLDDDQLELPLEAFNQSTLGQHIRHIYDFYLCLVGLPDSSGVIDYSARERNPKIECDSRYAIEQFISVVDKLNELRERNKVKVVAEFSADTPEEERVVVDSTIGRELMYVHDHALHHLAIIKIGLKQHFPGIRIDSKVGVAPSTLRYRATELTSGPVKSKAGA